MNKPGRPGIAYEDVERFIADEMASEGKLPAIAKIVSAVGGSATTIARFRKRYLEEHNAEAVTQGGRALPDLLSERVQGATTQLWEELVEGLQAKEQELDRQHAEHKAEAANAIAEAMTKASEAEHRADETAEKLATTLERLSETEKQLKDTQASLNIKMQTLADVSGRNETLAGQIATLTESQKESLQQADVRASELKSRIEDLEQRLAEKDEAAELERIESRKQLEALALSNQQYVTQAVELNKQLDETKVRVSELEETVETQEGELRKAEQKEARLTGELKAKNASMEALEQKMEMFSENIRDLSKHFSSQQTESKKWIDRCESLEQANAELRQTLHKKIEDRQ